MKTAEQKAEEFIKTLSITKGVRLDARDADKIKQQIVLLLKYQDRDTRHACAEAVISLARCSTANENAIYNEDGECVDAICLDQAHNACINAQAI